MSHFEGSDFLFTLAYIFADKRQRKWIIIACVGIPLCVLLVLLWAVRPYRAVTNRWNETYDIVGTEHQQFWTLKGNELIDLVNEQLPDELQLTCLYEPQSSSGQLMLTHNGETWDIIIRILPETAGSSLLWNRYEDVDQWLGNTEDVTLSLYSKSDQDIKENEQYARCLISIFTPGAEDYVVSHLGLSSLASSGIARVKVGNVLYTRTGSSPKLLIEPDVENWTSGS